MVFRRQEPAGGIGFSRFNLVLLFPGDDMAEFLNLAQK